MVMLSPLGTPETYFETGSSKRNFPSWTNSTITAAVMVLVFEAMLKCVSARGSVVPPSSVVPYPNTNSPCGVRSRTMVPGTSSLAVASTVSRSATGSKGLRFVADAVIPPKEQAMATTSARIRVVMIQLLGHADELMVGPPTFDYGTTRTSADVRCHAAIGSEHQPARFRSLLIYALVRAQTGCVRRAARARP